MCFAALNTSPESLPLSLNEGDTRWQLYPYPLADGVSVNGVSQNADPEALPKTRTSLGIDAVNPWGLRASLFSSRGIFSRLNRASR